MKSWLTVDNPRKITNDFDESNVVGFRSAYSVVRKGIFPKECFTGYELGERSLVEEASRRMTKAHGMTRLIVSTRREDWFEIAMGDPPARPSSLIINANLWLLHATLIFPLPSTLSLFHSLPYNKTLIYLSIPLPRTSISLSISLSLSLSLTHSCSFAFSYSFTHAYELTLSHIHMNNWQAPCMHKFLPLFRSTTLASTKF